MFLKTKLIAGLILGHFLFGKKNGITITPTSNLVKNIGFGYESTHSVFLDKKNKLFK